MVLITQKHNVRQTGDNVDEKEGENNYEIEIKIKTFKYVALGKLLQNLSKNVTSISMNSTFKLNEMNSKCFCMCVCAE